MIPYPPRVLKAALSLFRNTAHTGRNMARQQLSPLRSESCDIDMSKFASFLDKHALS